MATYAVGDIQGCFEPLQRLLDIAAFDPAEDRLWVAGDLVNRGPDNLSVLRLIKNLGDRAISVLGNHDLHLLATADGVRNPSSKDTIEDILNASDRDELLDWLRQRPLCYREGNIVMSHAGIPHIWSVNETLDYAKTVETMLRSDRHPEFFKNMYGNKPKRWKNNLDEWRRLRVITNYLTRMRFIDEKGRLDFDCTGPPDTAPEGMRPWYSFPRKPEDSEFTFLFGHWAALEGTTGISPFIALDTGCVWGGKLSMIRLEDRKLFQVASDPHN